LTLEKQDTSKVLLLMQLSKIYLENKPDTSLLLAQQGLKLSKRNDFAKGEALSLKAMGTVFGVTGNYPKGLEMLLQSLKISENNTDKQGIMICYVAIGANYSHQGDYRKSLDYFYKSKQIAETIHNERYQLISLLDIGDSYEKINQLDSARSITQQCLQLAVQYKNAYIKGIALTNLGNIHAKMGQDADAIGFYRQSIPVLLAEDNDDAVCESAIGLAKLFKKEGKADSALYYAHQSLVAAVKGGFTKRILDAGTFLTAYYESISLINSAFAYQKISIAAKDSLFSQEKVKEMQNLSFAEQIRQLEIKEAADNAAERRKKNIQMALIGVFIPVFFGIILLFRKRKANPRTLAFMGLLALLMLFEFITMIIDPYIEEWTHDTPVLMLVMFVAVASILVPMHHKLEHLVKERLAHKKLPG
jgi:tetratricopeptide (TPR) repeat protein